MNNSPELVAVIRGWFESVIAGDPSWADEHGSTEAGARLIGTDPGEVLAGQAVATFLRNEAVALAGRAELAIGEIEAFVHGDVGWGFARPAVTFPGGASLAPRWTAVFVRAGGDWRVVQIHASIAVGNETVGFEDHD